MFTAAFPLPSEVTDWQLKTSTRAVLADHPLEVSFVLGVLLPSLLMNNIMLPFLTLITVLRGASYVGFAVRNALSEVLTWLRNVLRVAKYAYSLLEPVG